jgi:tetratricopeptide (TPR) repeat protein
MDFAIRLRPSYAEAYLSRGLAYEKIGQTEQADEDIRTALKINPDIVPPQYIKQRHHAVYSEPDTVFISYRRINIFTALAVQRHLVEQKYDVFFDYASLDSGDFEQHILLNVEQRMHFVCLLTPDSLERCSDPNDWFRRELEQAITHKRNVIPLIFEGFDPNDFEDYLPSHLRILADIEPVKVGIEQFDHTMQIMCDNFLTLDQWKSTSTFLSEKTKSLQVQEKQQPSTKKIPSRKVFISYSSLNRNIVNSIANQLQSFNCNTWYDQELVGGQDWWSEILKEIRNCEVFCLALSPQSLSSYPCLLEYEYASKLNKIMLPIKIDDISPHSIPPDLARKHYVDLREHDIDTSSKLLVALNTLPICPSLPEPLPQEPDVPLSPLTEISYKLRIPILALDEQRMIVSILEEYIEDAYLGNDARSLLINLREHRDLRHVIYRKIERVLTL